MAGFPRLFPLPRSSIWRRTFPLQCRKLESTKLLPCSIPPRRAQRRQVSSVRRAEVGPPPTSRGSFDGLPLDSAFSQSTSNGNLTVSMLLLPETEGTGKLLECRATNKNLPPNLGELSRFLKVDESRTFPTLFEVVKRGTLDMLASSVFFDDEYNCTLLPAMFSCMQSMSLH
ncbi:hypothetical protein HPB48_011328 [Haemaphysalis longicornis]|uniref:Uncharacterized protein n=1 Tax=Haemaphysalis longicornis TaxID=44386 RepID=A0A9J6H6P0_HAELO|nr:hypothetical protein HPB48_011328 [Haemaphysalis longicornis]